MSVLWLLLLAATDVLCLYTEIFLFKGRDECQRRCLLDPTCDKVTYSKINYSCYHGDASIPNSVHITRSEILTKNENPTKKKQLLRTCMFKQQEKMECISDGMFACHVATRTDQLNANSMCIPLNSFTQLYLCTLTRSVVDMTCDNIHAWEQPDNKKKKRKIMTNLLPIILHRMPTAFYKSKTVTICGTPKTNTQFGVSFVPKKESVILFHFNPRFSVSTTDGYVFKDVIIFNHKFDEWATPVESKDFPFVKNEPFLLNIWRKNSTYIMQMEDHTWKYRDYRVRASARMMYISKELDLKQLEIF